MIFIPKEEDFRRWVREAVKEVVTELKAIPSEGNQDEGFISRLEAAKMLKISLPTLTDWAKRGLPKHKQRGRVYYMKSEIVEYLRKRNKE